MMDGIPISEEQCIGDSLPIINNSFQTLDTRTYMIGLSTRYHSVQVANLLEGAIFKPPEAECNQVLTYDCNTTTWVASAARIPYHGSIAAWACFSGSQMNEEGTGCLIFASSNISLIQKIGIGKYDVNFTHYMPHLNYAVFCGFSGSAARKRILCVRESDTSDGDAEVKELDKVGLIGYRLTDNEQTDSNQWYFAVVI